MSLKWIVVVNRTGASVYTEKTFRLIAELSNELGREKNKALTTDNPGWSRSRLAGSPVHSMDGGKDPHEDAAIAFAKEVDEFLLKGLNQHQFDNLLVVAEPKMLGRLKSKLDKKLIKVTEWLARDLSKAKPHELPKLLAERA